MDYLNPFHRLLISLILSPFLPLCLSIPIIVMRELDSYTSLSLFLSPALQTSMRVCPNENVLLFFPIAFCLLGLTFLSLYCSLWTKKNAIALIITAVSLQTLKARFFFFSANLSRPETVSYEQPYLHVHFY